MVDVVAIVLAAGRASRFVSAEDGGQSKVVAKLEGRALVAHVVGAAAASHASRVVVVTGQSARLTAEALRGFDVVLVHNAHYAEGMAGSIAAAVAAVPAGADAAIILLADMPRVSSRTIDTLIDAFELKRPDAVAACHNGRRGNPVLIARSLFPALSRLRGDEGARSLLADGTRTVVMCEVEDPAVLVDIDTREELAALAATVEQAGRTDPPDKP